MIGCYKDGPNRTLHTLEGTIPILDDYYKERENPIEKCYLAAISNGFRMFAVQNGGLCFSSSSAEKTYDRYGRAYCVAYNQDGTEKDGTGGPMANSVYQIVDGGMFKQFDHSRIFRNLFLRYGYLRRVNYLYHFQLVTTKEHFINLLY